MNSAFLNHPGVMERSDVLSAPRICASILGRRSGCSTAAFLHEFSEGPLRIVVAMTVIEVGVNVPNATIIVIEHTERFGLAQFHQLRHCRLAVTRIWFEMVLRKRSRASCPCSPAPLFIQDQPQERAIRAPAGEFRLLPFGRVSTARLMESRTDRKWPPQACPPVRRWYRRLPPG